MQMLWLLSLLPSSMASWDDACIHYNQPTVVPKEEYTAREVEAFAPDSGLGATTWYTLISAPDFTPTYNITAGIAYCVAGGTCLQPHTHTAPEVYYITKGRARMTLGDKQREVKAGDSIFIPGSVTHGIVALPNDDDGISVNGTAADLEWFYVYALDGFGQVVYEKNEE